MASPKWRRIRTQRLKDEKNCDLNAKMTAIKLDDVMCPVCLCILMEPVTMPCSHNLCMSCFQQNVQETSLLCPVCRKRISSWSRKASRDNCLVNQLLWKTIQDAFPEKVKRRQLGKESDTEEETSDDEESKGPPMKLSKPGEIREEYERQLKKLHEENEKEREREDQQSSVLIEEIQAEEERLRMETQRLNEKDHMIALLITQQLQEAPVVEESTVVNSILSNIDEVLRPATVCSSEKRRPISVDSRRPSSSSAIPREQNFCANDKLSSNENYTGDDIGDVNEKAKQTLETPRKSTGKLSRSNSLDSDDSITPELRHFRPIKVAPKTPPLRLPDGRVKETTLIHATPRALVYDFLFGEPDRNDLLRRRLTSIEEDRRKRFEGGVNMNRAELSQADRRLNLLQPLTPFSTAPGNCTLGVKPEQKYALSDLTANKENPKTVVRKRKLLNTCTSMETAKKCKGMLGQGDINVPETKVCLSLPRSQRLKVQITSRDPDSDVVTRKRQEEADRLLAVKLHRELNCKRNVVDRRTGTRGEYNLRSRDNEVSFRFRATTSF